MTMEIPIYFYWLDSIEIGGLKFLFIEISSEITISTEFWMGELGELAGRLYSGCGQTIGDITILKLTIISLIYNLLVSRLVS